MDGVVFLLPFFFFQRFMGGGVCEASEMLLGMKSTADAELVPASLAAGDCVMVGAGLWTLFFGGCAILHVASTLRLQWVGGSRGRLFR